MVAPEQVRKGEEAGDDSLREALCLFLQELIEAEVSAQIGAARYERSEKRMTQRNGTRRREWATCAGTLELALPKLRTGSYFPSWLSRASAASKHWSVSSPKPTCRVYARAWSTRWCKRWAKTA